MKRNLREVFKSMEKKNKNLSFASVDEVKNLQREADSCASAIMLFSKLGRRKNPAANKRGSGSN